MRKEDQNLKTLCNIISPEPTDDEGAETQYEAGMEFSDEYDLLEMHTNFGNDDYKEIYKKINYLAKENNLTLYINSTH